jgi:hypothetical protein
MKIGTYYSCLIHYTHSRIRFLTSFAAPEFVEAIFSLQGSHGGDCENYCLLECDTVKSSKCLL